MRYAVPRWMVNMIEAITPSWGEFRRGAPRPIRPVPEHLPDLSNVIPLRITRTQELRRQRVSAAAAVLQRQPGRAVRLPEITAEVRQTLPGVDHRDIDSALQWAMRGGLEVERSETATDVVFRWVG